MTVTPAAPQAPPVTPTQLLKGSSVPKKNDHDGDEVGGADPKNESAKGASPLSAVGSSNPNLGKVVNTTA